VEYKNSGTYRDTKRMMTPAKMVLIVVIPLILVCVGCSTSEFGGSSATVGKKESKKDSKPNNNSTKSDLNTEEIDSASSDIEVNHDGAQNFEKRSDIGASEHNFDTEIAEGCKLPKNVKSTITSTPDRASGGKGLFGLLGWGGGGGVSVSKMEVNNLDIRDCTWFEKVKADPNVKFAYIFQKKGLGLTGLHSYAEPAFNVTDMRVCTTKASDVTRSIGNKELGILECVLIPRDKDGKIIEN
jgi:hypothetical protein